MKGILAGKFMELTENEYQGKKYYNVVMYDNGRVISFGTKTPEVFQNLSSLQDINLKVDVGSYRGRVFVNAYGAVVSTKGGQ